MTGQVRRKVLAILIVFGALVVVHVVLSTLLSLALVVSGSLMAGYVLRGTDWRGVRWHSPSTEIQTLSVPQAERDGDFDMAVDELRKLARRCDGEAKDALLGIARNLAALSRAGLPDEETRMERHLARSLRDGAAGLRQRGGEVSGAAVLPLASLSEALAKVNADARSSKEQDFALTCEVLETQFRERKRQLESRG